MMIIHSYNIDISTTIKNKIKMRLYKKNKMNVFCLTVYKMEFSIEENKAPRSIRHSKADDYL